MFLNDYTSVINQHAKENMFCGMYGILSENHIEHTMRTLRLLYKHNDNFKQNLITFDCKAFNPDLKFEFEI